MGMDSRGYGIQNVDPSCIPFLITYEGMDLKDMHICGSRNHPDVGQGSMSGNFNHYLQGF